MLHFNIPPEMFSAEQGWGLGLILLYFLFWLLSLGLALTRMDLDPVTRLMWVLVVILVPFVGMILYFVLSPARPTEPRFARRRHESDRSGTPWENDPGYGRRTS